ncbi:MAG TPA: gamma-glutamyltransferase [Terriglobia bacterium]|nr:gamma-glutamyltransferase [Terriglobia bacterium]
MMTMVALPAYSQSARDLLDRSQARSMVITRRGIAATSQTLASQAAAQILSRGGSATDAAIAANATLGVVECMMNGMGGDLFAIEWDAKTGKLTGLNASGWAPEKLTPALLRQKGFASMPHQGIYSVTVPGAVRGWEVLHQKFGRLPWSEIFQPAIYYAKNGFPVTEFISAYWRGSEQVFAHDPNGAKVLLIDGKAPAVGQVFHNPGYARALELVASQGADAFYDGDIAKAILRTSDRLGGVMTAADLGDFKPEWVEPISTGYRGWTVYELPPNGQGMAALAMLNIFEKFPLPEWGFASADAFHVKIEAQKLAYADLYRYNADPRFVKVPAAGLISKDYAAERAGSIDLKRARCEVRPGDPSRFGPGKDTIYLSVVDRDGNIVSLIQSLYSAWGSGVVVDDYGFALQNRGALFTLDPRHPDVLAPHKRPFHTIIPAFMERGDLHIGFGIMGGANQAQAHAQFVSDVVDYGMNIQAALEAPRFTKPQPEGCGLLIEDRVPAAVMASLRDRGHQLDVRGDFSSEMGGGQAVLHDSSSGVNYGASDPRKDGAAVPEPDPYFTAPSP